MKWAAEGDSSSAEGAEDSVGPVAGGALEWPLARVGSLVGLQVAFLGKGDAAVGADKGALKSVYSIVLAQGTWVRE